MNTNERAAMAFTHGDGVSGLMTVSGQIIRQFNLHPELAVARSQATSIATFHPIGFRELVRSNAQQKE